MVSVMLYPSILCVALLMDLFVLCVRNVFGCGCYFVVDVMEVYSVGGGDMLYISCLVFQRMCVICL